MVRHTPWAVLGALALLAAPVLRAQEGSYRVVVHTANPIAHLTRAQVSQIFLITP